MIQGSVMLMTNPASIAPVSSTDHAIETQPSDYANFASMLASTLPARLEPPNREDFRGTAVVHSPPTSTMRRGDLLSCAPEFRELLATTLDVAPVTRAVQPINQAFVSLPRLPIGLVSGQLNSTQNTSADPGFAGVRAAHSTHESSTLLQLQSATTKLQEDPALNGQVPEMGLQSSVDVDISSSFKTIGIKPINVIRSEQLASIQLDVGPMAIVKEKQAEQTTLQGCTNQAQSMKVSDTLKGRTFGSFSLAADQLVTTQSLSLGQGVAALSLPNGGALSSTDIQNASGAVLVSELGTIGSGRFSANLGASSNVAQSAKKAAVATSRTFAAGTPIFVGKAATASATLHAVVESAKQKESASTIVSAGTVKLVASGFSSETPIAAFVGNGANMSITSLVPLSNTQETALQSATSRIDKQASSTLAIAESTLITSANVKIVTPLTRRQDGTSDGHNGTQSESVAMLVSKTSQGASTSAAATPVGAVHAQLGSMLPAGTLEIETTTALPASKVEPPLRSVGIPLQAQISPPTQPILPQFSSATSNVQHPKMVNFPVASGASQAPAERTTPLIGVASGPGTMSPEMLHLSTAGLAGSAANSAEVPATSAVTFISTPNPAISALAPFPHLASFRGSAAVSTPVITSLGSGTAPTLLSSTLQEHTTLVTTPNILEVGIPSGTAGWLRIRAEMQPQSGEITASLVANTAGAVESLNKQVPAMTAYLVGEQVHVSSILVERAGWTQDPASFGGSLSFGEGNGQQGSSAKQGDNQATFTSEQTMSGVEGAWSGVQSLGNGNDLAEATLATENGSWVNIRA